MAEVIEVRRHSLRGAGKSLSPEGIALAKRVAPTLVGNFHAAYSSPKTRCTETLQAFGFTAWKIVPEFGLLPERLAEHEAHVDALQRRTGCSDLEAYFAIPATHLILEEFGRAFFAKVCELARELHHGKNALAISHGGSIEPAVLAAVPDWDLEDLGGELKQCEGALFHFADGAFSRVELRRLD